MYAASLGLRCGVVRVCACASDNGCGSALCASLRLDHLPPPVARLVRAFQVPNSKEEGFTPIYKSPVPMKVDRAVTNLRQTFLHGWRAAKDEPCLGFRPINADGTAIGYVWMSYDEVKTSADNFASGVSNLDLAPLSQDPEGEGMRFLGFFCKNCPDWVIASQGCNLAGVVVVPLYDTLGASAVQYVVNQTQMSTILCSVAELATVKEVAAACPCLRNVIVVSDARRTPRTSGKDGSLTVYTIEDVIENGADDPVAFPEVSPDAVATFCYTSGTTGNPKGAMLTHDNIVQGMYAAMSVGVKTRKDDVHISYLPLAHMVRAVCSLSGRSPRSPLMWLVLSCASSNAWSKKRCC